MLDNNLLEAFGLVLDCGGFEKAAKSLFISQSAVSQRIKQLEDYMGQVLIVRTSPPRATSAGRQLFKHYKQVKCLENEILSNVLSGAKNKYTVLTIGVNADSLATWFYDIISEFTIKNNVLINIIVDDQDETRKLLKDGEVVGCISASNELIQGCSYHYLGSMQYSFAANKNFCQKWFGNGVSYDSAADAPTVMFNTKDNLHYKLFKNIFQKIPPEFNTHYMPSPERLLDAVLSGLGYGAVPNMQADKYFKNGELVDIFPGVYIDVNLYWHCWNIDFNYLKQFTSEIQIKSRELLTH